MNIGRTIYYRKSNGVVIWDKGELTGDVVQNTLDQDKVAMPVLTMIDSVELGVCQLNYGDYVTEFSTCKGWKIDVTTGLPSFIF